MFINYPWGIIKYIYFKVVFLSSIVMLSSQIKYYKTSGRDVGNFNIQVLDYSWFFTIFYSLFWSVQYYNTHGRIFFVFLMFYIFLIFYNILNGFTIHVYKNPFMIIIQQPKSTVLINFYYCLDNNSSENLNILHPEHNIFGN